MTYAGRRGPGGKNACHGGSAFSPAEDLGGGRARCSVCKRVFQAIPTKGGGVRVGAHNDTVTKRSEGVLRRRLDERLGTRYPVASPEQVDAIIDSLKGVGDATPITAGEVYIRTHSVSPADPSPASVVFSVAPMPPGPRRCRCGHRIDQHDNEVCEVARCKCVVFELDVDPEASKERRAAIAAEHGLGEQR